MFIETPTQDRLVYWKEMTEDNDHTRACYSVARWLVNAARQDHGPKSVWYYARFVELERLFNSMLTIERELGHTLQELAKLRCERMGRMIRLVRKVNPAAADSIKGVL